MFERRYCWTRSNGDRRSWIDQTRRKQRLYASKQNQYWEDKISSSRGNPSTNLSAVLRREKTTPVTAGLEAEGFARAFSAKLENVQSTMSAAPQPSYTDRSIDSSLDSFEPVDATTVQRLISHAANKTCELDPAPTWLVKRFAGELSPFITALFNASFRDRVFSIHTEMCCSHSSTEEVA